MAFITPKTNWAPTDFINYSDYNRIVNNLYELNALARVVFNKTIPITNMVVVNSFLDLPTPRMYNIIEGNLQSLNSATYKFPIGGRVTFYQNSNYIDYTELNRIESAILKIYKTLTAQEAIMPHLPIQLGESKIFSVVHN